ncbi:MAG: hypothetical protein ABEJ31_03130 [Haloarculaceae archaeon]
MTRSSITRIVVNNPRKFLGLIAAVGAGAVLMQVLATVAPDTGIAQVSVFVLIAAVAALYVGSTHEEYERADDY